MNLNNMAWSDPTKTPKSPKYPTKNQNQTIQIKSNLAAEQRGIVSNGVNPERFIVKFLSR